MVQHKPWFASKTIWANLIIIALAALVQVQVIPGVPPEVAPWIVVMIATLNAALRVITSTAITGSAASLPPGTLQPPPQQQQTVGTPLDISQAGAAASGLMVLGAALANRPVVDSTPRKIADEDSAGRDLTATHAYEDSVVTQPPPPLE
jgi:hypothetical protein